MSDTAPACRFFFGCLKRIVCGLNWERIKKYLSYV
jgi:hypothetical protein